MSNGEGRQNAVREGFESRLVIGTAGHVDHGKTTLIRALTGRDTDRLPEEKNRGISIELGFAPFTLPSGARAAIVDVPGHERFVHHMLAGAQGMDLVLLVVAADEGVMPQTREHLDILSLLGLERGIVCLTKIDLVDPDWRDLVVQELRGELRGSFLQDAPVVGVSPVTGQGMAELLELLEHEVDLATPRAAAGPARLPIDRVFSVAGFGTVVTGTLVSGRIAVEDRLELVPGRRPVRVRSLQSHGEAVQELQAGQRTAVNLAGVDRAEVERGQVLAAPGSVAETSRVALHVRLLASAPALGSRMRVRLHIGTSEVIGRVTVLDQSEVEPGGEGFVRFHAEAPFPAAARDRVVLRSFSPSHTIGGGMLLDLEGRQRKGRAEDVEELRRRLQAPPGEVLRGELRRAFALRLQEVAERLGLSLRQAEELATEEARRGTVRRVADVLIDEGRLRERVETAKAEMRAEWERDPLWRGLDRDAFRRLALRELDARTAGALAQELGLQGEIRIDRKRIWPAGEPPSIPQALRAELEALVGFLREGGLQPSSPREWPHAPKLSAERLEAMLLHLQATGRIERLSDIWFAADALQTAEAVVQAALPGGRGATTAELRELLGTSRKFAVPILEHLDQRRITRRQGDLRYLVRS